MSSIYLTSLTGTGTSTDPYVPAGFGWNADRTAYAGYTTLMTDAVKSVNCIVLSDTDGVVNPEVQVIATAPNRPELRAYLRATTLSQSDRNRCNQFQGRGNQNPLPPEVTTWWGALYYMASNLNPALNLDHLFG